MPNDNLIDDFEFNFLDEEAGSSVEEKVSLERPPFYENASDTIKEMVDEIINQAREIRRDLTSGVNLSASERKVSATDISKKFGKNEKYISSTNRVKGVKELYHYLKDLNKRLSNLSEIKFVAESKSLENMTKPELIEFARKCRATTKKAREAVMSEYIKEIINGKFISQSFTSKREVEKIKEERDKYILLQKSASKEREEYKRALLEAHQTIAKLKNQLQTQQNVTTIKGGKDNG